jgi:hypothetical protein
MLRKRIEVPFKVLSLSGWLLRATRHSPAVLVVLLDLAHEG